MTEDFLFAHQAYFSEKYCLCQGTQLMLLPTSLLAWGVAVRKRSGECRFPSTGASNRARSKLIILARYF